MSKSSVDQQLTFITTLACNANLSQFTAEQLQLGIKDPVRAGRELAAFIRNGCRVQVNDLFLETGELEVNIPALTPLTDDEIKAKYPQLKTIELHNSPTEPATFALSTVLRTEDNYIDGTEYELRRSSKIAQLGGLEQLEWLVAHQDDFPDLMALVGKVYIDAPGFVAVDEDGLRVFPCARNDGGRFVVDWRSASDRLRRYGRLLVSRK